MTQKTSSFLDAKYGWDYGESGWNTGMDEDILKFSFLFDKNIEGIVSSLPSTVTNGTAYFLSTDKRIYFGVGGVWYSTPTPKWFILTLRTSGVTYQFNGTDLVSVPSNSDLASQLSAVQVTISTLGTAAFKNIEYFTTPAQLAAAVASSQSYTDSQVAIKAAKGANSDITSLSGLTTPLTVAQGGTGGSTTIAARSALGLGNAATKNTRALDYEIITPVNTEDGVAFGYKILSSANGGDNKVSLVQYDIKENASTTSKIDGVHIQHVFGGGKGGRHGLEVNLLQGFGGAGATAADNPNRFYVAGQFQALSDSGDGGTSTSDLRGALFGVGAYAGLLGQAQFFANLTAGEFNTDITAGSGNRVAYHAGIQIAQKAGERGYAADCAIAISSLAESAFGWKHGILFHDSNGRWPFDADSTVIKIQPQGAKQLTSLIDAIGVDFSSNVIGTNYVRLTDGTLSLLKSGSQINIGSPNIASTVTEQFRSSGLGGAYDVRLVSVGGTSTAGNGVLQIDAGGLVLGGTIVRSGGDGTATLGGPTNRWSTVYATTGTINTSDADEKTEVQPFTTDELNAAKTLAKEIGTFKWLGSIQAKGEDARTHVGLTVQRAIEVMEENNLDPMAYGFICYDEWEATDAVTSENEEGEVEVIQPATEAGSRYGFRMDQLNLFIAAGFEARLSALEAL